MLISHQAYINHPTTNKQAMIRHHYHLRRRGSTITWACVLHKFGPREPSFVHIARVDLSFDVDFYSPFVCRVVWRCVLADSMVWMRSTIGDWCGFVHGHSGVCGESGTRRKGTKGIKMSGCIIARHFCTWWWRTRLPWRQVDSDMIGSYVLVLSNIISCTFTMHKWKRPMYTISCSR